MTSESSLPVLGLTMGDAAGVGPEVVVKALAEADVRSWCRPLVLGDPEAIRQAVRQCRLDLTVKILPENHHPADMSKTVEVLPLSDLGEKELVPGRPTPAGGRAAARYIEIGAKMALDGTIHALVTAPISKESFNQAGYRFPGHTEFLAHLAGNPPVVMMLAGPRLRVVLVTIHVRYRDVPDLISPAGILSTAQITHKALKQYFGLPQPRLAVAALNPHAGEGGLFGHEEETIVTPAVNQGKKLGLDLNGPYPADTLFYRAAAGEFDAVVCLYHDQGLIPLKLLHFKDGINVTLGLPFIRTSVDHGTAYDLAGKNLADHTSMLAAMKTAAQMTEQSASI